MAASPTTRSPKESPALGIQAWSQDPIVGRGLLLDLEALHAERGHPLDHTQGPALDPADLDAAAQRQGCEIRDGDLILVHTGWAHWYLTATDDQRNEVRTGRRSTGFAQSRYLAQWLWNNKIALFGTDTFAVEVLPVLPDSPVHASPPPRTPA